MKKKLLVLFTAVVMCLAFTACGGGSEQSSDPNVFEADGCSAEYTGYEIMKDANDEDALVLSYTFTNNSEESQSFSWAFVNHVFQDGVELEYTTVWKSEDSYDSLEEDTSKEIQPGNSLEVKTTKKLQDTKTPVQIEFESFDGNATKTIDVDITK